MRIALIVFCCIISLSACKKSDKKEIYNENNTSVIDGVVYDIDEKPINGLYKTYFSNGNVKMEVYSQNGKPNGTGKFYNERGRLIYEGMFVDGRPVGTMYQYYANGNVHNEMNYTDGMLDGTQRTYDKRGELMVEIVFDKGQAVSGYAIVDGENSEFTPEELQKFNH